MQPKDGIKTYKKLSARGRALTCREEGLDVEFKEGLSGLEAIDLVAFANSDLGGSILVGVREKPSKNGRRVGEVIGCNVGDRQRLAIFDKAQKCVPPIPLRLYIENADSVPFLRIEVSSGQSKPYCTAGGTYKIRGQGHNQAILPDQLLLLFLQRESDQFIRRFRDATQSLSDKATTTLARLVELDSSMQSHVNRLFSGVGDAESAAQDAESAAGEARSAAEETAKAVEEAATSVREANFRIDEFSKNQLYVVELLRALLNKMDIEDPLVKIAKDPVRLFCRQQLRSNGGLTEKELVRTAQTFFPEVPFNIVQSVVRKTVEDFKVDP